MKYFFALGSNPALSTAEIHSVLNIGAKAQLPTSEILIISTEKAINPPD
jgi:hypothetical protein